MDLYSCGWRLQTFLVRDIVGETKVKTGLKTLNFNQMYSSIISGFVCQPMMFLRINTHIFAKGNYTENTALEAVLAEERDGPPVEAGLAGRGVEDARSSWSAVVAGRRLAGQHGLWNKRTIAMKIKYFSRSYIYSPNPKCSKDTTWKTMLLGTQNINIF